MRAELPAVSAVLCLLGACGPDERFQAWPVPGPWAAAALVEVEAQAERVALLTPVELEDGQPDSPLRYAPEGSSFELVLVERAPLVEHLGRVDAERLAGARIRYSDRMSCEAAGEIEAGLVSYPLDGETEGLEVLVFHSELGSFEPVAPPAWLSELHFEAPAVEELDCLGTSRPALVPVTRDVVLIPPQATVAGRPLRDVNTQVRNLHVLADGRILASMSEALVLRHLDDEYADDPKEVLPTYVGAAFTNFSNERNDLVLVSTSSTGVGEVWFSVVTAEDGSQLHSVRFDASGFGAPILLSELPGTARVRRLLRDESGLLLALLDDGTLAHAEAPTGPWGSVEVGLDGRMLQPVPGRRRTFLVNSSTSVSLVRFTSERPEVIVIGSLTNSTLYEGDIQLDDRGGHQLVVPGRGQLFLRSGLEPGVPWHQSSLLTRTRSMLGCASAPTCGLRRIDPWIQGATFVELSGEDFVLIGASGCSAPLVVRLRDDCISSLELDVSEVPTDVFDRLRLGSPKVFLRRRGRLFVGHSEGGVFELITR